MTFHTFIYLLSCGIFDRCPDLRLIPADTDWREIRRLANLHTVVGVVADAVSKIDDKSLARIVADFQALAYNTVNTNAILNKALTDVVSGLGGAGIPCVLLKGQGVAANYPFALLRQCGDIDLYVGRPHYAEAMEYARRHLKADPTESDAQKLHCSFVYNGVTVELHHRAMMHHIPWVNSRLQRWTKDNLCNTRTVEINGTEVEVPGAQFDAFFLFYHIWYHFLFEGIGLRQICDWTLLLHAYSGSIDTGALRRVLKMTHLLEQWQTLGCLAVDALGLPKEEMPLYDPRKAAKARTLLGEIAAAGNFGSAIEATWVPENEGIGSKFMRVARFTFVSHVRKLKYDRVLNLSMLLSKLTEKSVLAVRLAFGRKGGA